MENIKKEDVKIKTLLQQKNREGAMLTLKRRKMYEEDLNRQQNMVNNLIQQKINLEAAEETSSLFQTLSLATSTNKQLLSANGSDLDTTLEEYKSDLAEQ